MHGLRGNPWWQLDWHSGLLHWWQSFLHTVNEQAKLVILKFCSPFLLLPLLSYRAPITKTQAKGRTSVFSSNKNKTFSTFAVTECDQEQQWAEKSPWKLHRCKQKKEEHFPSSMHSAPQGAYHHADVLSRVWQLLCGDTWVSWISKYYCTANPSYSTVSKSRNEASSSSHSRQILAVGVLQAGTTWARVWRSATKISSISTISGFQKELSPS